MRSGAGGAAKRLVSNTDFVQHAGLLVGKYDDIDGKPGILFPDGNKWMKVSGGTPGRRPPNETLKGDNA